MADTLPGFEAGERGRGRETRANTPEECRALVAPEMEKWGKVVREGNIKLG